MFAMTWQEESFSQPRMYPFSFTRNNAAQNTSTILHHFCCCKSTTFGAILMSPWLWNANLLSPGYCCLKCTVVPGWWWWKVHPSQWSTIQKHPTKCLCYRRYRTMTSSCFFFKTQHNPEYKHTEVFSSVDLLKKLTFAMRKYWRNIDKCYFKEIRWKWTI